MSKTYFIATNNQGKAKEIVDVFGENSKVVLLKDLVNFEEVPEDGSTFAENSEKKAINLFNFVYDEMIPGDLVISDDSGIVIPELGISRLGVYTKREMLAWTKEHSKKESEFWSHIAKEAKGSKVQFIVAITVIKWNGDVIKTEEVLEGNITFPRGNNGFAFDTIFEYEGKTLAERNMDEKKLINPRVKALIRACESSK